MVEEGMVIKAEEPLSESRDFHTDVVEPAESLDLYREKIGLVDRKILNSLRERFVLTNKIGELKKLLGRRVVDEDREERLKEQYQKWAIELGLDVELVKSIFLLIMNESKKQQESL